MKEVVDKAAVLVEALPYMRRFVDQVFVIKYGGAAMTDLALRKSFARDVVLLKYIGLKPVIVHGRRVTDDVTMEVVEMVLGGSVNREIVALVQAAGGRAIGLTGNDGGLLRVERRLSSGRDLGRVGKVVAVDPAPIQAVLGAGFVPVIAPIGIDGEDTTYNVNADEAAGAIAQALLAEKLILLTDVQGVLDASGQRIAELRIADVQKLIGEGTIRGGMIPKVECCTTALAGGVKRTHIVDGRELHALLLEIFTDSGAGTLITR
jgi:acetylglutamate kinase